MIIHRDGLLQPDASKVCLGSFLFQELHQTAVLPGYLRLAGIKDHQQTLPRGGLGQPGLRTYKDRQEEEGEDSKAPGQAGNKGQEPVHSTAEEQEPRIRARDYARA